MTFQYKFTIFIQQKTKVKYYTFVFFVGYLKFCQVETCSSKYVASISEM